MAIQWRHNGRDGVSHHQPHDCLFRRLFRRRSTKISKFRVTDHCAGSSPVTGEFPHKWTLTRKMFPFDDVIMGAKDSNHYRHMHFDFWTNSWKFFNGLKYIYIPLCGYSHNIMIPFDSRNRETMYALIHGHRDRSILMQSPIKLQQRKTATTAIVYMTEKDCKTALVLFTSNIDTT